MGSVFIHENDECTEQWNHWDKKKCEENRVNKVENRSKMNSDIAGKESVEALVKFKKDLTFQDWLVEVQISWKQTGVLLFLMLLMSI